MKKKLDHKEAYREALKYLLKGRSQNSVAIDADISQSQLSKILSGVHIGKIDIVHAIADALNTTYEDMLFLGRKIMYGHPGKPLSPDPTTRPFICMTWDEVQAKNIDTDLFIPVPYHKSGGASAYVKGKAFDIHEEVNDYVMIYALELRGRAHHKLHAMAVYGDSMEPVIPENSIIVMDVSEREFENNKIFALNKDDYGIDIVNIKRVKKDKEDKVILLVPENNKYPIEVPEMSWDRMCIGRVIWMWRSFD